MFKFSSKDALDTKIQELLANGIKFATPISHILPNLDYTLIYIQVIGTVAIWGYIADLFEEDQLSLELL